MRDSEWLAWGLLAGILVFWWRDKSKASGAQSGDSRFDDGYVAGQYAQYLSAGTAIDSSGKALSL